ncbi:MAG: hypothetical protein ACK513_13280, partial [Aphanizomenon sp.]
YSAGRIDAAATFFEPRYVVLNAAEGIPDTEVSGVVKALAERHAAEAKDQVYVRMAGNPVSRGDHLLTVLIDIPTKILPEERELLEKLAKIKGDRIGKGGLEGFLGGLFKS